MIFHPLLAQIGPNSGSPFEDASLPFEQLKAPPDSAFEVMLASACLFLLIVLVTLVFVALSKLRAIEEKLDRAGAPDRTAVDEIAERVERALDQIAATPDPKLPAQDADALVELLGEQTQRQRAAMTAFTNEIRGTLRELGATLRERPRIEPPAQGHAPARQDAVPTDPVAAALALVRARLESQGYSSVEIITPREEITGDVCRSGSVVVEARRSGAVCKGRVQLEDGAPVDVVLRPGHEMFP